MCKGTCILLYTRTLSSFSFCVLQNILNVCLHISALVQQIDIGYLVTRMASFSEQFAPFEVKMRADGKSPNF